MISIRSNAKLNWYLRVLDRRSDGYHNIETVFQEIDFGDDLTFEPFSGAEAVCRIEGFPADVPAESNLITRAWQLLRNEFRGMVGSIQVTAAKRLPRGGGLGGGSSNAAAALVSINRLFELGLDTDQLRRLGASLGSDVPFFVNGGTAIGQGRGELIRERAVVPPYHIVLLMPNQSVSTADAYGQLETMPAPGIVPSFAEHMNALESGDPVRLAGTIYNDFERVADSTDWFKECKDALETAGVLRAFLCGSGSTVAGLARDKENAQDILMRLHENCALPALATMTARRQGNRVTPDL